MLNSTLVLSPRENLRPDTAPTGGQPLTRRTHARVRRPGRTYRDGAIPIRTSPREFTSILDGAAPRVYH